MGQSGQHPGRGGGHPGVPHSREPINRHPTGGCCSQRKLGTVCPGGPETAAFQAILLSQAGLGWYFSYVLVCV